MADEKFRTGALPAIPGSPLDCPSVAASRADQGLAAAGFTKNLVAAKAGGDICKNFKK